ncbi:ECF transporter S component [Erysipelothrix amsterdamensis]|uniref:ECF transporter S component n=1 Tax=Erysipelothrix amsterdamensis TaxID=2929157 RepID=A0AAU9VF00_9FIRM|nr:ECF transporter S component [Erysipelothrix sp. A18Y020d]CAH2760915.1 ECF transporter S component [Erysipelothrix sp. A18Y020d]
MKTKKKTLNYTLFTLFAAIIILLSVTPLGFIHLGFIKATIVHIPVIIGSIILGPTAGAGLGIIFGINSIINNTISPSILSFAFSPLVPVIGTTSGSPFALIIALLPRILVGIVPYYIVKSEFIKKDSIRLGLAGFIGSMTNTILVMGLIYLLFKDAYGSARGIEGLAVTKAMLSVIVINGIPEAIVSTLITIPITKALYKIRRK